MYGAPLFSLLLFEHHRTVTIQNFRNFCFDSHPIIAVVAIRLRANQIEPFCQQEPSIRTDLLPKMQCAVMKNEMKIGPHDRVLKHDSEFQPYNDNGG